MTSGMCHGAVGESSGPEQQQADDGRESWTDVQRTLLALFYHDGDSKSSAPQHLEHRPLC